MHAKLSAEIDQMNAKLNAEIDQMNAKFDAKVDSTALWTVRDMVSSLRVAEDARRRKVDEAINALNGQMALMGKDLAAMQKSMHTTQNSLSDCLNEVAAVWSDAERNPADAEAQVKGNIHQKLQEAFEKALPKQQTAAEETGSQGGSFVLRDAKVIEQPADGSSLFHALDLGLCGRSCGGAEELRHELARSIAQHPQLEISGNTLEESVRRDANMSCMGYATRLSVTG